MIVPAHLAMRPPRCRAAGGLDHRTLLLAALLAVAAGLGCGPYYESAQFGWSTGTRDGASTPAVEVSRYVRALLPSSGRSSAPWPDEAPGAGLPLAVQVEVLRDYLALPRPQRSRGTALRRLAIIEGLGADHPQAVERFLAGDRAPEVLALAPGLADFVRLEEAWRAYVRGDHASVLLALPLDRLEHAHEAARPHLRYLRARAMARLEPEREPAIFASLLMADPVSPWAADARGWRAHGLLAAGRYAEALAVYADLCVDPSAAHLHEASRLSLAAVLSAAPDRGALARVLERRPWLAAAATYFDALHALRSAREPARASARWRAVAETIERDHGVEPPWRALELAAIHGYEAGDYDGAIELWTTIPAERRRSDSARPLGLALAARAVRTEPATRGLAERLRTAHDLSEDSARWLHGEMGRRLLARGRPIDAAIELRRGGFGQDWRALVDTCFDARDIRRLRDRGRGIFNDGELDRMLGRQLAREGRFDDAVRAFGEHGDLADQAERLAASLADHERRQTPESAMAVAWAYYRARPLLQRARYLGWRSAWALGYQRLGLTHRGYGRANNYRSAQAWFEYVVATWPDAPEAADALYWSAICAFWTSDLDWYWATLDRGPGPGGRWRGDVNLGFIEEGAAALRRLLDRHPDHEHAAEAARRLEWAERKLDGYRSQA